MTYNGLGRRLVARLVLKLSPKTWMGSLRHARLTSLVTKVAPADDTRSGWRRKAAGG
jgi:hypothetical protein